MTDHPLHYTYNVHAERPVDLEVSPQPPPLKNHDHTGYIIAIIVIATLGAICFGLFLFGLGTISKAHQQHVVCESAIVKGDKIMTGLDDVIDADTSTVKILLSVVGSLTHDNLDTALADLKTAQAASAQNGAAYQTVIDKLDSYKVDRDACLAGAL